MFILKRKKIILISLKCSDYKKTKNKDDLFMFILLGNVCIKNKPMYCCINILVRKQRLPSYPRKTGSWNTQNEGNIYIFWSFDLLISCHPNLCFFYIATNINLCNLAVNLFHIKSVIYIYKPNNVYLFIYLCIYLGVMVFICLFCDPSSPSPCSGQVGRFSL